jgi:hypothetical protein
MARTVTCVTGARVDGAMVNADGLWRVEALRRGESRWYRTVQGEDVIDRLAIGQVNQILDVDDDRGAVDAHRE